MKFAGVRVRRKPDVDKRDLACLRELRKVLPEGSQGRLVRKSLRQLIGTH